MADTKITALTAITTVDPANDVLPIVDVSDTSMAASGTTKKITTNQILGASGTATLASATITGDLTVDTSTLKVDAANNRVGIGTASPTQVLTVRGNVLTTAAAGTDSYANVSTDGVQNSYLGFNNSGSTNAAGASNNNTYIGNGNNYGTQIVGNSNILASFGTTGVFNWYDGAGGTRMTLNSTGLGIGLAPVGGVKLSVAGTIYANAGNALILDNPSSNFVAQIKNTGSSLQSTLAFLTGSGTSMLIDNSGNVGIGVTPSAGKGCLQLSSGITFPATQVASSDANTLDDYEEGTWTVGLTFGGASTGLTTNANLGKYTKIGNQVTVTGYISLTNKGSATGAALITGLPFLVGSNSYGAVSLYLVTVTFADYPEGYSGAGTTTIPLQQVTNAGVRSNITDANFANNSEIIFSLTYFV